MAKVNIVRWDATNLLPKLLSDNDTAMVNAIDVTGSGGTLSIGTGDADIINVGSAGAVANVDGALTASAGLEVHERVNLPSGSDFLLSGTAMPDNFTATNFTRLFNGANVDDLHIHAPSSASLSGADIPDPNICWTYVVDTAQSITGSEVVYISAGDNKVSLADSNAVGSSRIIGFASGSSNATYTAGDEICVFTVYGQRIDGFTGLTAGSVYYLSETAGAITASPDYDDDVNVVQVGIAASATELVIQPDIVVRGLS